MYNEEGECGTGAVVPWAGRLWVITYGPHKPMGSSDKLYEITPGLKQIIRPESIGGTPANRMIHKESNQLNIGPYFIDHKRKVRVIPYTSMPGRHTGTARHLKDPANKVYVATMEEGLYSVDVHDLSVVEHVKDGNPNKKYRGQGIKTKLPGYHGKGLYSSQGTLVYANNGERGKDVTKDPTVTSGALATWQGSGDWKLVRLKGNRDHYTEHFSLYHLAGEEPELKDYLAEKPAIVERLKVQWNSRRRPEVGRPIRLDRHRPQHLLARRRIRQPHTGRVRVRCCLG